MHPKVLKCTFLVLVLFMSIHRDALCSASLEKESWTEIKSQFLSNERLSRPIGPEEISKNDKEIFKKYFREMASKRSSHETEYLYNFISITSIFMTTYAFTGMSTSQIIKSIALSNFVNQVSFLLTHLKFHANFIGQPVNEMNHQTLFALYHHYIDSTVFNKYWQAYRGLYFFDSDENGVPKMGNIGSSGWLHLAMGAAYFYFLDRKTAIAMTGLQLLWTNLQAITHEWYHVPQEKKRKEHFNSGIYRLLTAFELLKVIDSKKHKEHHKHDMKSLPKAKNFFDINAYFAADEWDDRLFQFYQYLSTVNMDDEEVLDKDKLRSIASAAEKIGVPTLVGLTIFILHKTKNINFP